MLVKSCYCCAWIMSMPRIFSWSMSCFVVGWCYTWKPCCSIWNSLNICHEIHVKHCCILLVACYVNITMAIISRFCWISIDKLMLQMPCCCYVYFGWLLLVCCPWGDWYEGHAIGHDCRTYSILNACFEVEHWCWLFAMPCCYLEDPCEPCLNCLLFGYLFVEMSINNDADKFQECSAVLLFLSCPWNLMNIFMLLLVDNAWSCMLVWIMLFDVVDWWLEDTLKLMLLPCCCYNETLMLHEITKIWITIGCCCFVVYAFKTCPEFMNMLVYVRLDAVWTFRMPCCLIKSAECVFLVITWRCIHCLAVKSRNLKWFGYCCWFMLLAKCYIVCVCCLNLVAWGWFYVARMLKECLCQTLIAAWDSQNVGADWPSCWFHAHATVGLAEDQSQHFICLALCCAFH